MSTSAHLHGSDRRAHVKAALRGEIVTNPQPRSLYAVIAQTVLRSQVPAKAIADAAGLKYAHLTDLANDSRHVALKFYEAPGLILASGDTAIADWLEARIGRVAFAMPAATTHPDVMHRALARNVERFGEFLRVNGDALADGRIEPHEADAVLEDIDAMVAGLCEYRELVKAKAAQDLPLAVTA